MIIANAGRTEKIRPARLSFTRKGRWKMKKGMLCVLAAALLLLAGCGKKNISVDDALCPYSVEHKGGSVYVRLHSGELTDPLWQADAGLENVCGLTQEESKDPASQLYRIDGVEEGFSRFVFQAAEAGAAADVRFRLVLTVMVDGEGKVTAETASHQESRTYTVETEGTACRWEVDMQGVLTFRLLDRDETWSLRAEDGAVCAVTELTGTPNGWKFEARPLAPGTASVVLRSSQSGRSITVQLQVDEAQNISLAGVQG